MSFSRFTLVGVLCLVAAVVVGVLVACSSATHGGAPTASVVDASDTHGTPLTARAVGASATIDYALVTPVPWDRMYVFGPYSNRQAIEERLGFSWPDADRSAIDVQDGVSLVVFVKGRSVAYWYDQPWQVDVAGLDNGRWWDRAHSVFRVERGNEQLFLVPQ